jgi:hypothetical protein
VNDALNQYKDLLQENFLEYQRIQKLCQDFESIGPKEWEEKEILNFQLERKIVFDRIKVRSQTLADLEIEIFNEYGVDVFTKSTETYSSNVINVIRDVDRVRTSVIATIQSVINLDQKLEVLLLEETNRTKTNLKRIQNTRQTVGAYSVTIKPEARFIDKSK